MANHSPNPDQSSWTKLKTQVYNSGSTALTISQFSKVPWVRFSNACTGQVVLRPEEYERIAEILHLHPMDLVGFNDPDMEVVSIQTARERNGRLRRERDAMARLRSQNPELYARIVYGESTKGPVGEAVGSGSEASNGSRG